MVTKDKLIGDKRGVSDSNPLSVTHFSRRRNPGAFSIERVFADVRGAMPAHVTVREVCNAHFSQGVIPRLRDAWAARRNASQVNHITGDVHYLTYFLPRSRNILTVHDTVFVERARGLKRVVLWFFWLWLPLQRCQAVTTISQESKRRLLQLVNICTDRIEVIPDPVSSIFEPLKQKERVGPFRLLHIGTKANKNLERLIPALINLDVELTVIGKLNETQKRQLDEYCVPHRALFGIDDEALRAEYARAEALIFVSLEEGFGLPILEAQAMGRPVLTSRRPPMDDVAGESALLVDPEDPAAIRTGVERLMSDAGLRSSLVVAGLRNVERFRPEMIASAYAELYRKVWVRSQIGRLI